MCVYLQFSVVGHILVVLSHQYVDGRVSAVLDHNLMLTFTYLWPKHRKHTQCASTHTRYEMALTHKLHPTPTLCDVFDVSFTLFMFLEVFLHFKVNINI